jgi:hypothetical protein
VYGLASFYSGVVNYSNVTMCNGVNVYGGLQAYANSTFNSNLNVASNLAVYNVSTLCNATKIYGTLDAYGLTGLRDNLTTNSNILSLGVAYFSNLTNCYQTLSCYSNVALFDKMTSTSNIITNAQFLGNPSDTSNLPSFSWSNNSNTGLYRPATNTIGFVIGGADKMRLTSAGRLAVGNSNARELLELYKGNILSKNCTRLTKTTASLGIIDLTINWESTLPTDQYYLLVETSQQAADGTQVGVKIQRHLVRLFDTGNTASPTIRFSQAASTVGNSTPANSFSITPVYVNSTSLTLRSSTSWSTSGSLTHSFTVDILQVPDNNSIGFVWLT